jgi:HEAT repeat protein
MEHCLSLFLLLAGVAVPLAARTEVPADVAALIAQLESGSATDRAKAAASLAHLGSRALPALPALLARCSDRDDLWRREGRSAVHTSVRDEALGAIRSIGPEAVPQLLAALGDHARPESYRAMAAAALGELKDARAVPALISSLNDSAYVVQESVAALGKIGDRRAVEPLLPLLTHDDSSVANAAADALAKLGDRRAVEPLLAALPVWTQRHWGGLAGRLETFADDPRVIAALIDQLRGNADVIGAAHVLGKVRSAAAVDALIPHLKSTSQPVRCSVAEALGSIKDSRAVEPLVAALAAEKESNAIAFQIKALEAITGQSLGERSAWLAWWSKQN